MHGPRKNVMKYYKNETASFHCEEAVLPSLNIFCDLVKEHSFLLNPFRGMNEKVRDIMASREFVLYPTVKKTTLFYDRKTDCFLKIIHPVTLKNLIVSFCMNRAKALYTRSRYLLDHDIKVPYIMAYGLFRKGRSSFSLMKRIAGRSLYESFVKQGEGLSEEVCLKVMNEIIKVHRLGYWFGDAHLSHIFLENNTFSGFIDIDSIRKNRPFRLKNLAKDLAGLNHPKLPLSGDEKKAFMNAYMEKMQISSKERFVGMTKRYIKRRWDS
jgi:tRNA A-37 threonylcarbamoyl transferase component Bud32